MKKLTPLLILILVLSAGGIYVFLNKKDTPGPYAATTITDEPSTGSKVPRPAEEPPRPNQVLQQLSPDGTKAAKRILPEMSDWDRKLEAILTQNEKNPKQAVLLLLNMLPTLKEEEQAEAADHAANLLEDEDYASVMPQLVNARLPEEIVDIFYTDLLNRPDELKLPALLEVARQPGHPYHEEAKETLSLFLGEDYQENWPQWKTAIVKYLTNGEAPQ